MMRSGLYVGSIEHIRHLPRQHRFRYPFFMWYLNLSQLDKLPDLKPWFSLKDFALSRLRRSDYLGSADQSLEQSVRQRIFELTNTEVEGDIYGLMNLRTLGLYFSPVNFYFGVSQRGDYTHMLAEVANTPWNERHHYAFCLSDDPLAWEHAKEFHVSPFNPDDQTYSWTLTPPGEKLKIHIAVDDRRGHIFDAILKLNYRPLTKKVVRPELLKRPVMAALVAFGIYWQALKLFIKKVPYVPYLKENK